MRRDYNASFQPCLLPSLDTENLFFFFSRMEALVEFDGNPRSRSSAFVTEVEMADRCSCFKESLASHRKVSR